ncbi:NADPH-dependent aldehyde reductase-like protein, chloroplastic [Brachypodium distachyon]|uniref:NADPH-dependent aldehyde reductase-like protein, chloroplastic n=1 Tax=Brachypodium distachyon TaxID=15368 RepID=UPI000234FDA8|nr:NADPH-dependent aldehyde reductase-like protein, chloroplastic [Brachypodium distachyon]|eukprot:XP_003571835.1 NADPH-dependent aldehyde reductase-like protein, chloroplastic [Brachypodium distachyon]
MAAAATGSPAPLPALDGRVALVTGGSRGIGREVSSQLAALGAGVVINYASDSAKASALAAELNAGTASSRAVAAQADVSDPSAVRTLFDRAEEAFGSPPHIVVACAGLLNPKYPSLGAISARLGE